LLLAMVASSAHACDVIRPFTPEREFVLIGEVVGTVGPFRSPSFDHSAWGLEVEVREAIQLPRAAQRRYEVVPLLDCDRGGYSREQIEQWFPAGLAVLVVAEEARVFPDATGRLRLERESDGYGFVVSNRGADGDLTNADVLFDYEAYADNGALRARAPRLAEFELFKDLVRLKQAADDATKLALLARLRHYPCCTNHFRFEDLVNAHLATPALGASLVLERRAIEAADHEAFQSRP
jgi:hypothetical protein